MTVQDFAKIKFRMVSHLNMGQQHGTAYESVDYEPKIAMCVHTPVKDGIFGRAYVHYDFNGQIYKTKKKFLEAITAFEEEHKHNN